jgi:hypothetical protein
MAIIRLVTVFTITIILSMVDLDFIIHGTITATVVKRQIKEFLMRIWDVPILYYILNISVKWSLKYLTVIFIMFMTTMNDVIKKNKLNHYNPP